MSEVWGRESVARGSPARVRRLRPSDVRDSRHDLAGYAHAAADLVPSDVVTSQKTGASALGLQQVLGFGSYETAWTWLHKLRRAMVRPGRDRLTGTVEVDETLVGGVEEWARGRQTEKKAMIAVAAEERGAGIGRIRLRRIPNATADSLQAFVQEAVAPGSVLHTDGLLSYDRLEKHGYRHRITFVKGRQQSPSELLPRVHKVISLLKRWLLGTHQGAVSRAHLDYYLDEFTFRFNRRTARHRGKLFYRLVQQAVAVDPAPYASLVKHVRSQRRRRHHNI
jgi:transposase-like protein